MSNETRVRAAVGGRELTLDPLRTLPVVVEVREVESTIPCGFQSEWATGTAPDGTPFGIYAGAGFGSRWGTVDYRGKNYAFDIEQFFTAFMAAVDKADEA